jgi:rhodanese-related sulfurtransferase
MDQLITFIKNHWALWLAFIGVLGLLIADETSSKGPRSSRLSPQDAAALINHDENLIIIDLRSNQAFQSGHILGAINLPENALFQDQKKLESFREKTILLVENHETVAAKVAKRLAQIEIKKVFLLAGGITAWRNASLPLVKK